MSGPMRWRIAESHRSPPRERKAFRLSFGHDRLSAEPNLAADEVHFHARRGDFRRLRAQ
jgi:hypothetical protein